MKMNDKLLKQVEKCITLGSEKGKSVERIQNNSKFYKTMNEMLQNRGIQKQY
jgi:hypothetical protein